MSSNGNTYLHDVEQAMRDATRPMKEQYATLEAQIAERVEELERLREARNQIRRFIAAVEPGFGRAEGKPGPKQRYRTPAGKFSDAKITSVGDWLQANAEEFNAMGNGDGFYATKLSQRDDSPVAQSSLAAILNALHDRGVVRVTKAGGIGGRKYFKVVV